MKGIRFSVDADVCLCVPDTLSDAKEGNRRTERSNENAAGERRNL